METSKQTNDDFLPWVEKYRPKTINEIISHAQNIETIKKLLMGSSLPHLLFHGSSGTGKTSTIIALAKEIYGNNIRLMVMKLDASDDRGINSVREDIKGFAEKSNMFQKGVRLIILDEADSMTFDAQFALRRIIEKYSATIRFCLICNYENKIIPAIRSRCANFRFSNIDIKHICFKLNQIAKAENLKYESNVIETIATLAKGDLRKAINLIQSISMQSNFITNQLCWETAGVPSNEEIKKILNTLYDKNINFDQAYQIVANQIKIQGYSLSIVLKELIIEIIERWTCHHIDVYDNKSSNINLSSTMINEPASFESLDSKSSMLLNNLSKTQIINEPKEKVLTFSLARLSEKSKDFLDNEPASFESINNELILKNIPKIISDLSDLENMVTKSTFGDIYITSLVGIFTPLKI